MTTSLSRLLTLLSAITAVFPLPSPTHLGPDPKGAPFTLLRKIPEDVYWGHLLPLHDSRDVVRLESTSKTQSDLMGKLGARASIVEPFRLLQQSLKLSIQQLILDPQAPLTEVEIRRVENSIPASASNLRVVFPDSASPEQVAHMKLFVGECARSNLPRLLSQLVVQDWQVFSLVRSTNMSAYFRQRAMVHDWLLRDRHAGAVVPFVLPLFPPTVVPRILVSTLEDPRWEPFVRLHPLQNIWRFLSEVHMRPSLSAMETRLTAWAKAQLGMAPTFGVALHWEDEAVLVSED